MRWSEFEYEADLAYWHSVDASLKKTLTAYEVELAGWYKEFEAEEARIILNINNYIDAMMLAG